MQLCEWANESIALLDIQLEALFAVKGNRMIGFMGRLYDDLLIKPEKRLWVRMDGLNPVQKVLPTETNP